MRALLCARCREGISLKSVLQPASGIRGKISVTFLYLLFIYISLKYSSCQGAMYWGNMFCTSPASLSSGQKRRKIDFFKKTNGKMSRTADLSVLLKDVTSPPQFLWSRTRGWYVTSSSPPVLIPELPPTQLFREDFFYAEDSFTGNAAGPGRGFWLSFQGFWLFFAN